MPVEPSHGNYFEIGATKSLLGQLRFDANYFRRYADQFADDDQTPEHRGQLSHRLPKIHYLRGGRQDRDAEVGALLRFCQLFLHGRECVVSRNRRVFLGDDALNAATQLAGHFPDSQDQRNTVRARLRYQVASRLWLAGGAEYGSGLPFEFTGTISRRLPQYGPAVVRPHRFYSRPSAAVVCRQLLGGSRVVQERSGSLRACRPMLRI